MLVFVSGAFADDAADKAAADVLFQEARALMEKGAIAEACPKFAASQKFDPRPGRLLALGDCYEQAGATASAWATFREAERAASQAKNDAKAERQRVEAQARVAALEPHLSKLVIEVGPEARVEVLAVKRNGKPVDEAAWGVEVPVDPGTQELEASAVGRKSWAETVKVSGEGTVRVKVPVLEKLPEAKPSVGESAPVEQGSGKSVGWMVVGGGLGLVGAGVGVGLTLASSGLVQDADAKDKAMPDAACAANHPDRATYTSACADLRDTLERSRLYGQLGVGALVVGGALGVGTVIYALSGSKKPPTDGFELIPTVAPTFAGLTAMGRF